MSDTYINLFRNSLKHRYFKNVNLWHFYQYCMLKASYKKRSTMVGNQSVTLEVGQFVFGRKAAAEDTGLTENEIRTCLKILEKDAKVTIKTTNKFSIITLINFSSWQQDTKQINQQTNQQPTNNLPTTYHKQEGKEGKEGKEVKKESTAVVSLTEKAFIACFDEKESRLKELYPHADFAAQRETCIAHYRTDPSIVDSWPVVLKWFNRIPKPAATETPSFSISPRHADMIQKLQQEEYLV